MIDIGRFHLPAASTALFLDIDGTLLDLAERPGDVIVPQTLREDLGRAHVLLGGALALVSGRAVTDIDRLFTPLPLPASGVHGSEFRPNPPGNAEQLAPRVPDGVRAEAEAIIARYPGTLLEDKGSAVALHWRRAPQFGEAVEAEAAALMQTAPPELTLLRGHSVLEIKGRGLNKGFAVERFLGLDAFRDRVPVFVGDDTTDEPAFAAATRRGGLALSVGRAMEGASDWFAAPADVRAWLSAFVRGAADALAV